MNCRKKIWFKKIWPKKSLVEKILGLKIFWVDTFVLFCILQIQIRLGQSVQMVMVPKYACALPNVQKLVSAIAEEREKPVGRPVTLRIGNAQIDK